MKTLEEQLDETLRLLDSYQDLATDQEEDDSFVARGNGFCDAKYSEDFVEGQIARIKEEIAALENEE